MTYLRVDFTQDATSLTQMIYDGIIDAIPGYVPATGNLEVIIAEAIGRVASELMVVATDVPDSIFRAFGENIVGVQPIDATSAQATVTFTLLAPAPTGGFTIPANTAVGIPDASGQLAAFATTADAIVPATLTTLDVDLRAVVPGADASGLTGAAVLLDGVLGVAGVALVGVTTGGVDAEDDGTYLSRLVDELKILAPRPILPADFATMARQVPGVYRALAVDMYQPSDNTYAHERTVAVFPVDINGNAVSSGVKASVDALLQAAREVNFVVTVADPVYTSIAVTFTAVAQAGFDTTAVHDSIVAAIQTFLSPAVWGTTSLGDLTSWVTNNVVRYLDLAAVIKNVFGVDHVSTLTLNGSTIDVTLSGGRPHTLTTAGAISGTVT